MARHTALSFKLVVLQEMREWLERQFAERDGMVATQLMITDDGRTVPQDTIAEVLSDIETQVTLLEAEREEIERTQLV